MDHLWTTDIQKSAINDDSSRWMERDTFRYDFGELAAGKWRGRYGLITRRSLVQVQVAPSFLTRCKSMICNLFSPNPLNTLSPKWGNSGGIANHNYEQILTQSNTISSFSVISPRFPPDCFIHTLNRIQVCVMKRFMKKCYRIYHPMLQLFATCRKLQITTFT